LHFWCAQVGVQTTGQDVEVSLFSHGGGRLCGGLWPSAAGRGHRLRCRR
jgi:hypothetical protein